MLTAPTDDEGTHAAAKAQYLGGKAQSNPLRALELVAWTGEQEIVRITQEFRRNKALSEQQAKTLMTLGEFFAKHQVALTEAIKEQMGAGIRNLPDAAIEQRFVALVAKKKATDEKVILEAQAMRERLRVEEANPTPQPLPVSELGFGEALAAVPVRPVNPPVPAPQGGGMVQYVRCTAADERYGRCMRKDGHTGHHKCGVKTWMSDEF